jgi:predicted aspartyl protease
LSRSFVNPDQSTGSLGLSVLSNQQALRIGLANSTWHLPDTIGKVTVKIDDNPVWDFGAAYVTDDPGKHIFFLMVKSEALKGFIRQFTAGSKVVINYGTGEGWADLNGTTAAWTRFGDCINREAPQLADLFRAQWNNPPFAPTVVAAVPPPAVVAAVPPAAPPVQPVQPVQPSTVIEVPLIAHGGTFQVDAIVNGTVPIRFDLDSGAADVTVPNKLLLHMLNEGTLKVSDYQGDGHYIIADGSHTTAPRYRLASITLGGKTVYDVGASGSDGDVYLLGQTFLTKLNSWAIENSTHTLKIS